MKDLFTQQVAATSICLDNCAFLIQGEPGAGKSLLALQLLYRGACLISDDITRIIGAWQSPMAVSPERGSGCLEVRSIGIVSGFPVCPQAPVRAVINLVADCPERIPKKSFVKIGPYKVPLYQLWKSNPALVDQAWTVMQLSMGNLKLKSTLMKKE